MHITICSATSMLLWKGNCSYGKSMTAMANQWLLWEVSGSHRKSLIDKDVYGGN
jgi:hypothetical protein